MPIRGHSSITERPPPKFGGIATALHVTPAPGHRHLSPDVCLTPVIYFHEITNFDEKNSNQINE